MFEYDPKPTLFDSFRQNYLWGLPIVQDPGFDELFAKKQETQRVHFLTQRQKINIIKCTHFTLWIKKQIYTAL